jgi:DNA-binding response OmpR family regulator
MATSRKILIADPELDVVRSLSKALRQRGYQVTYAPDGSKALEMSVLRHPDVVLFDDDCTLIDAKSFVNILQSNPRTGDIPVVLTTHDADVDLRTFREGYLKKPFNMDEVLSRIDHLCRRVEAARELKGDAREIEGGLAQLPLADLMQILSMNRRTGRLTLAHAQERGEVMLSNGRPVNARSGDVEGEKALFRLLAWKEGQFAFIPGPAPARSRIDRSMEDALLEGARQTDERSRLLKSLPPPRGRVSMAAGATPPVEPHPVTAEVLALLKTPRRVTEILDLADAPDLELMAALATLLEKGVIVRQEGVSAGEGPLLGPAEVHALRGKLLRGHAARGAVIAKILVVGSGPKAGRYLLRALPGFVAVATEPGCLRSGFGTLGRLDVGDVLKVDFLFLPTAEAARPLWKPLGHESVGALVLEDSDAALKQAKYFGTELKLPVVVATGSASGGLITSHHLPPMLRGIPGGASMVTTDLAGAVRTVLLAVLHPSEAPSSETVVRHSKRRTADRI